MQALTIFDVTAYGEGTGHLWHPRALSGDHDDSERFEQVLWKVFPKINPTRAIKDSDRSDRLVADACTVGDRADNVAGVGLDDFSRLQCDTSPIPS